LLGAVIRIGVRESSAAEPYRIPEDDPFLDTPGARSEIWAYGVRNPWRMSIDHESGEVWFGDVQVSEEEEVDLVQAGDNLGWPIMEGSSCLRRGADCDQTGLAPPAATYLDADGRCAVMGGIVYRGDELRGHYLFADFCGGEVWSHECDGETLPEVIAQLAGNLVTFAADYDGEVLVAEFADGGIYRLQLAE